jgi:hypothetical protein
VPAQSQNQKIKKSSGEWSVATETVLEKHSNCFIFRGTAITETVEKEKNEY